MRKRFFLIGPIAIILTATAASAENNLASRHVVLVVWDGMRPDFATEKYAPTLDKLAHDGVRFAHHHSVYPTATDVNGAAIATGCYPNRSGLCANLEFRPAIDAHQPVDTSDPEAIKRGDEISGGKYLALPTFPELLRKAGKTVALAGTKSVALLFDRHNDWTVVEMRNRPLTIFAGAPINASQRNELVKLLGPFADDPKATAVQRNDFATRALTQFLWRDRVPDFSLLWLSEPDLSQHNFALGSPQAVAAIKGVDSNLATVLSALEKKHVRDSTDVLVVSDHGFSTIRRSVDLITLLTSAGFRATKELPDSPETGDIIVAGNGGSVLFYVQNHERETTQRLVDWLQHSDFTGVIFTRDKCEGTFLLSSAHLDTGNPADVIMSFRWNEQANSFRIRGQIDADWNRKPGEGTHATLSPTDINNTLIAGGPDFRVKFESETATANVDLAPTILSLLGEAGASATNGRIMSEAMVGAKKAAETHTKIIEANRTLDSGIYHAYLELSGVGDASYINAGNGGFKVTGQPEDSDK